MNVKEEIDKIGITAHVTFNVYILSVENYLQNHC